jgi:putative FmdB family regulatory protein
MPLYEYKCDSCKETFEVIRRITEKDDVKCPECGKPAKRQITGFALGGSGDGRSAPVGGGGCRGGG